MVLPKKYVLSISVSILCGILIGSFFSPFFVLHPNSESIFIKEKLSRSRRHSNFPSIPNFEEDILKTFNSAYNLIQSEESIESITSSTAPVTTSQPSDLQTSDEDERPKIDVTDFILNEINTTNLDLYLKNFTKEPHLAGTDQDLSQAQWTEKHLWDNGFDHVSIVPYKVLLSYPDKEKPNRVVVINEDNEELESFVGIQPPLHTPEESHEDVPFAFNGYSGTGVVEGELVYVYYGREEDLKLVESTGIDLKGKILLARYGKAFRGNIAILAQEYGASAVLLFGDPKDYAPLGRENVYPKTAYLPEDGIQLGTLKQPLIGDPLTPHYPALDNTFRIQESDAQLPKILVQPISYRQAEALFQYISEDNPCPDEWRGDLNTSYPLGPTLKEPGQKFKVEVFTSNKLVTTYNVIGTIRGSEEPDRYVLIGNHRDAWILGSIDASSGSIILMELARVFGKLKTEKGWIPRRSLVFCSWGAEEYGLVGSVEWVQHHKKVLQERAVAYLNVDLSVSGFPGRFTLRAAATPLLYQALYEAAKVVPNPNATEIELGRPSLYDTWLDVFPNSKGDKPKIGTLGTGSDYGPFIHNLGVPALDVSIGTKKYVYGYPLYHTLYETHHLVANLMDPGFVFHRSIAQLLGELARNIAHSELIPFNVTDYSNFLQESLNTLNATYGKTLEGRNISLESFQEAIETFQQSAADFHSTVNPQIISDWDSLASRKVNDQLQSVESSFIVPFGLPGRPVFNHIIFVPSITDAYKSQAFGILADFLNNITTIPNNATETIWKSVEFHITEICYYINTASNILQDYI